MYEDGNNNTKKIGLALSGGGYRAAAYHIGTLRALNRLGILDKVDVISSVSGGSITSAYYALNKEDYQKFEDSFITKLREGVLLGAIINLFALLLIFAISLCVQGWCVLLLLVLLFFFQYKLLPVSCWIEMAYDRLFFKKATLSDLPDAPLIAINSTDVTTGKLFTFSKHKMTGYLYEGEQKKEIFDHTNFPVSKAVMASSCVPFAFSPIRITSKHCKVPIKKDAFPLLIDGGLYDNQGAHKLSEVNSLYHTQINIVSDAGNSIMSSKWAMNIPLMLIKTSNIMMARIRTLQSSHHMFSGIKGHMRYVYLGLLWSADDRPVKGFVNNIVQGNISPELYDYHHIEESDIMDVKSTDKEIREAAKKKIIELLKQNIGWNNLLKLMPTDTDHSIAKSVGTNLTGLSVKKINALIKHSDWLTEVQIRLYVPYLVSDRI